MPADNTPSSARETEAYPVVEEPPCECVMRGAPLGKAHPLCPVHGHRHDGPEQYGVPVDPEADERLRADLAAVTEAEQRASSARASDAWTVPPEQRPACPLDGHACTSWTCLVDVCADEGLPGKYGTPEGQRLAVRVRNDLVRQVLEALCVRDGLPLSSDVVPDEPARNYELALRLGIGQVFGV